MTSAVKLLILEYLYNYYLDHQGEQFMGEISDLQNHFSNICPNFVYDATLALSQEGYIDGYAGDDTLSCIEITNRGVSLAEKLVAAKNSISIIEDMQEPDKQEIINTLPDLMVGSPEGVNKIPKIKTILKRVASGSGEIVKSVISDIASETILKTIGLR